MRRFYKSASISPTQGGFAILLDGREIKTPARAALIVPGEKLAEAIAGEWNEQGEKIDPRAMPFTGLANAAIDRITPDPQAFARSLASYGESDLTCYRAESPDLLMKRQAVIWDPLLAWARRRYDVNFEIVHGVIHRPQPASTLQRLGEVVAARPSFELAGLSPLITISGSLIIALALADDAIDLDIAWRAASLDEIWQAENWGEDAEAAAMLEARRWDFTAAWRFFRLL
jgi:chaperone required for assembly of F1-ATPase